MVLNTSQSMAEIADEYFARKKLFMFLLPTELMYQDTELTRNGILSKFRIEL